MSEGGFLELVISMSFFQDDIVDSCPDIEDALDQLLSETGLGEVGGGGCGAEVAIIDIEVFDTARIQTVLEQVSEIGRRFRFPENTRLLRYQPQEQS